MTEITGANVIAGEDSADNRGEVRSRHATTGEPRTQISFAAATDAEIAAAAKAADSAFHLAPAPADRRVELLQEIADALEESSSELLTVADEETGLGIGRLEGELARTSGQLRAFAELVAEGSFVDAVLDTPTDVRPDIRKMLVPLGPVAVFGASNFPLAFSVAGGDTAAALAAGCPVIAKAHPAHPETSERAARVIAEAVRSTGLHPGTFSLLQGAEHRVGTGLVQAAEVRAVAFTGSEGGGRALMDAANRRPSPIPVYAEMGSVNPVVVTRSALGARGAEIAKALAASIGLGCGQFCTKPGIIFVPADSRETFIRQLSDELGQMGPAHMLTHALRDDLLEGLRETRRLEGVLTMVEGAASEEGVAPTLLVTELQDWSRNKALREEHFGPAAIAVTYPSLTELAAQIELVGGSLTATIHAQPDDDLSPLLPALTRLAGRLVFNGVPTGVAVVPAMHHGGPYPATAHPYFTSVGTDSIRRFLRPVSYQDVAQQLLPPELHDENPRRILRRVDGEFTRAPVGEQASGSTQDSK